MSSTQTTDQAPVSLSDLDAQIAELHRLRAATLAGEAAVAKDDTLTRLEAELAENQRGRAGVLAEFADTLDAPDVAKTLDGYDSKIASLQSRIQRRHESLTEVGRARQAAYRAELIKTGRLTASEVLDEASGPAVDLDEMIADAIATLRDLLLKRREMRTNMARQTHQALKPLGTRTNFRARAPAELAAARHGTLDALLDVLTSREVNDLKLVEYSRDFAERLRGVVASEFAKAGGAR